ncbi:MAG TPA: hypothetical protein VM925_20650 [Labilithrix sp.]|nr:hypothetical protein [Labilithrix sp.]
METRLYVGNLPEDASSDALRKRFAEYGSVANVQIAFDRGSGRPRGYAFVTMASAAEARDAIAQLNGAMFEERPLRVNEAGAESEGSRARAEEKRRTVRITSQFRERENMTYELDCAGVPLAIKMFPLDRSEQEWRIEARKDGDGGAAPIVIAAVARTRAQALEGVARSWVEGETSPERAIDWAAVTAALSAIRAI